MKRMILLMLLLVVVSVGCGTTRPGVYGPDGQLTPKERARRAAAAAHPEGGPYVYTWRETVVIDGREYEKHGQAFVTE